MLSFLYPRFLCCLFFPLAGNFVIPEIYGVWFNSILLTHQLFFNFFCSSRFPICLS